MQARAKARDPKRNVRVGNAATAIENQGRPISPEELNRGVPRQGTESTTSNAPAPGPADGRPVPPSELGYFGGLFSGQAWGFGSGFGGYKDETGTFTSEPQRSQLTEPPPGYQTPSGDQPYGVTRRVERSKAEAHDPAGRDYRPDRAAIGPYSSGLLRRYSRIAMSRLATVTHSSRGLPCPKR